VTRSFGNLSKHAMLVLASLLALAVVWIARRRSSDPLVR